MYTYTVRLNDTDVPIVLRYDHAAALCSIVNALKSHGHFVSAHELRVDGQYFGSTQEIKRSCTITKAHHVPSDINLRIRRCKVIIAGKGITKTVVPLSRNVNSIRNAAELDNTWIIIHKRIGYSRDYVEVPFCNDDEITAVQRVRPIMLVGSDGKRIPAPCWKSAFISDAGELGDIIVPTFTSDEMERAFSLYVASGAEELSYDQLKIFDYLGYHDVIMEKLPCKDTLPIEVYADAFFMKSGLACKLTGLRRDEGDSILLDDKIVAMDQDDTLVVCEPEAFNLMFRIAKQIGRVIEIIYDFEQRYMHLDFDTIIAPDFTVIKNGNVVKFVYAGIPSNLRPRYVLDCPDFPTFGYRFVPSTAHKGYDHTEIDSGVCEVVL